MIVEKIKLKRLLFISIVFTVSLFLINDISASPLISSTPASMYSPFNARKLLCSLHLISNYNTHFKIKRKQAVRTMREFFMRFPGSDSVVKKAMFQAFSNRLQNQSSFFRNSLYNRQRKQDRQVAVVVLFGAQSNPEVTNRKKYYFKIGNK